MNITAVIAISIVAIIYISVIGFVNKKSYKE